MNTENLTKRKYKEEPKKLKNTITEIKNTLEGNNSRLDDTEEWISDLEDRMVEFIAAEQTKEKRMKEMKTA